MMKRLMEKYEIEDPSDSDSGSKKEVIVFSNSDDNKSNSESDDDNKTESDDDNKTDSDDDNKTDSDENNSDSDDENNKSESDDDNKSDEENNEKEKTIKIVNKCIDKYGYDKTKKILIPILKERKIRCDLCNRKVKVGNFYKHKKNMSHKNVIEKYNKFISDLRKISKKVRNREKRIIEELINSYQDELNKCKK
jgi:hypothetical protein